MKKKNFLLSASLSLFLALGMMACSNTDDDGANEPALSYNYITRNRGFIGGSVIYNGINGLNNQLEPGTKLGIRLGYLTTRYETVTSLGEVDNDSSTEITVSVDENDTMTGAPSGAKTDVQQVSEDIPSRARYGFLDITSVDAEKISFTATLFSVDGTSHTTVSKTIALGDGCDLNGDNQNDLVYTIPPIKRTGYEDARWLTFVCDEDIGHTTMYYTFTAKEKKAGYRAAETNPYEASRPAQGFYGVNSDGRFIYLQNTGASNSQSVDFKDAAFGDFVLGMDAKTKTFSSELDENDGVTATDIAGALQENATSSTVSVNANCTTVVGSSAGNSLDFENYTYLYDYAEYQFPDKTNGPKDLLDKLIANESVKAAVKTVNGNSEEFPVLPDKVIALLNSILKNEAAVKAIAYANNQKKNYDALMADTSITISGQKYARRIIDTCYTQSPKADIKSPDISNIYPFAYANVGDMLEGDYVSREAYAEYSGAERAICSSYDDFKAKRDTINKKWSEFSSFYIKKATYEDSSGSTKTIDFANDLGLKLAGGVKGGVSITSSKAQVDLGAAVYISLDASAEQIANVGIKVLTSGFKIGIPDTQMQIGPVPIVYGVSVVIGLNYESSFNPHICFVGLYGGETSFGAHYGINWKWGFIPWPYFNTFGSANKICETEAFIGVDTSQGNKITWGPWVTVSPSVGLGWSALSIRASAPITASFKMTNELPTFKIVSADLGLKVQFVPYFELSILKLIHIRKDFGTFDIVNGTLQLYPLPVKWK